MRNFVSWYTVINMMPSAAKQQQQTVVKNGTTTTTTTVITNQSTLDNTKFTQAELGTRSFARTVEKNIAEMNKKKGEVSTSTLSEIKPHEVSHIPDDLTFGSTTDASQLPQTVIDILAFHGITFSEGDRVIHIPGAKYFSISKMEGEVKTYRTFSLDEDIVPPEPEPTAESIIEESAEIVVPETEVSVASDSAQPLNTDTLQNNTTVSQNTVPVISQNTQTNTLGTIGVSQSVGSVISEPTVPENFMSQFASGGPTSDHSEPATQTVVTPTKEISTVSQEIVSETAGLSPLQIKLEQTRRASNRERDAYFANRYINSITGTITELFGSNTLIQSELFKTIQDYDTARRAILVEMGTTKKTFHEVVSWVKQEQIEIAHLFSHQKNQLFTKLAKVFHLSVPSIIETRTGAAPMVSQTSVSVMSQKLGLVPHVETGPAWSYLFSVERPVKLDFTKTVLATTTVNTDSLSNTSVSNIPTPQASIVTVEQSKKVDRAKLYNKIHDAAVSVWLINKEIKPITESISEEVIKEPVVSEQIAPEEKPKSVSRPMAAISFQPEPDDEPTVDMNSPMKQHPEELFI